MAIAPMTPERWQRIERLYHAARARAPSERARFSPKLAEDEELRREVESLLSEPESGDRFLAEPPPAAQRHRGDAGDR